MKTDAKLRMDVYQEGQRAFNAGTPCPYTDWRANTWEKGRAAAEEHSRSFDRPARVDVVLKSKALGALDSLDAYVRGAPCADPTGLCETLRRFIEQQ